MTRRFDLQWMEVLVLGVLSASTAIQGLPQPAVAASERLYTNPVYLWSVSYPADWAIDSRDPSFVRVSRPVDNALCGIHSGTVRFKTVDEFTDFGLAHNERFLKDRGKVFVILSRRRISLPNDIIGNDVLTGIGPGGKSRRIYVLADGRGFTVDCETYAESWERLEPFYDRIITSFTLGK